MPKIGTTGLGMYVLGCSAHTRFVLEVNGNKIEYVASHLHPAIVSCAFTHLPSSCLSQPCNITLKCAFLWDCALVRKYHATPFFERCLAAPLRSNVRMYVQVCMCVCPFQHENSHSTIYSSETVMAIVPRLGG